MQEENKNPQDYGYKGDEIIEISAREFMVFKTAIEDGINATSSAYMPEVKKYINTETAEEVYNPSAEDVQSGKVVQVMDRSATFAPHNTIVTFNPEKLTREMTLAQEFVFEIHNRNVDKGVAKHRSEFEKEQA